MPVSSNQIKYNAPKRVLLVYFMATWTADRQAKLKE
jgi:hypothetical protein